MPWDPNQVIDWGNVIAIDSDDASQDSNSDGDVTLVLPPLATSAAIASPLPASDDDFIHPNRSLIPSAREKRLQQAQKQRQAHEARFEARQAAMTAMNAISDVATPSFPFLRLPAELRCKVLECHLHPNRSSKWGYLERYGQLDLCFERFWSLGKGLGMLEVLRLSWMICHEGLDVLYGGNHFILFGRLESLWMLSRYLGFQELHAKFLRKIGPENVARMRALTLPGDTRHPSTVSMLGHISLDGLVNLYPGLRHLHLMTLDVCLLDYVVHRKRHLNVLMSDYSAYLCALDENFIWELANDDTDPEEITEICKKVNKDVWEGMVLRSAPLLKRFWPELKYVYEVGDAEVRRLIVSLSPLATQHPLRDPPNEPWELLPNSDHVS